MVEGTALSAFTDDTAVCCCWPQNCGYFSGLDWEFRLLLILSMIGPPARVCSHSFHALPSLEVESTQMI